MSANPVRMEFAPPPTPGLLRALVLAFIAHALLLAVLTFGVQWKRDAPPVIVEAELWSQVQQQAAPPPPPPLQPPEPQPPAEPVRPVEAPPTVPTPPLVNPNIALEQEKVRLQKEKQAQQERQEKEKQLRLAQLEKEKELEKRKQEALKIQQQKQEQEAREKEQRDKELREKLALAKKQQLEQQKALAAKNDSEAKRLADLRKQQLSRMAQMANQAEGSGDEGSTGSAKRSSGPSSTYAGRIVARIKPNITYTESLNSNPVADVEVRTSPDGTIISRKLVKSSGIKSWDDAVINAIDKTEKLPPDVDGKVIPVLTLGFHPKD